MNARERKAAMAYGEKYKAFLDTARTERLAAAEIIRRAEEKGFKPVYTIKRETRYIGTRKINPLF